MVILRILRCKFLRQKFIGVKSVYKCVLPLLVLFVIILTAIDRFRVKTYGDYEWYLCDFVTPSNKSNNWREACPKRPIVTVQKMGRLGNQMWQYASVWAVAKETGREAYVPSCLIEALAEVFDNLSIPTLSQISHCPVDAFATTPDNKFWNVSKGALLLPEYAQLPEYVVPHLNDVLKLFTFKKHLMDESQKLLKKYSKWEETVFVAVHVRRTDYVKVLPAVWNKEVVKPDYFLSIMEYFKLKYRTVVFMVLTDDPDWCRETLQHGRDDVIVINNSQPGQDLAIMTACNHSIIDYGTFGMWGAMLAGGETILYNLTWGLEMAMSRLMSNWRVIN